MTMLSCCAVTATAKSKQEALITGACEAPHHKDTYHFAAWPEQNTLNKEIICHIKEFDRRRVNKAQSANQNKGLNDDVQNACELLIVEIL